MATTIEQNDTKVTDTRESSGQEQATGDRLLDAITGALECMHREEFDVEILSAASAITGTDMYAAWRPSFAYLPPHKHGNSYYVTVFATGACEKCPTDRLDVESLQARLRTLVGSDHVFVDDYFDLFEWASGPHWVVD